jgi:glycosyltransferase involved in cell wall biosynthesis
MDQGHVRVIRRGVDAVEFPRGWRPTAAWRESFEQQFPELRARQWLTLPGRLVRTKGHADLLRLTCRLLQEGHPVHALIVGDTAERAAWITELQQLATSLGIGDHVTFAGHRSDIRDVYAASAVVLTLSHKPESFGLAAAEALSLGVPVAGYAHGGTEELFAACFPRGAVPPGDEAELAAVVRRIMTRPPAVEGSSQLSRPFPFVGTRMAEQTLDVYRELASNRRNTPGSR